ncbi:hypothetical protein BDK51DRAFT_25770 [Blyttiomyces helicus]|uniref:Uncharacterized protein n=1 Tax=Blyttiomyces helicus TaxID=388810 RepID=A0A4P9W6U3_9FUNG|nr:hypothetical protein BDK51DRAFT_25770 [Blyttiomyces helicus]|eukprot:RKO86460.1 hypothetical protein BDK51DRAFT_25770 [Blyttiomyces helicus]
MFSFASSPKRDDTGAGSPAPDSNSPTAGAGDAGSSVDGTDEGPLMPSPEAPPGSETSCMHFLVKSKLGWIAWKEREASLYALFERSFGATRCDMKLSETFDELALEVEVPNDQVEKFQKFFRSKALLAEIGKVISWIREGRGGEISFTGLSQWSLNGGTSIEALPARFGALSSVNQSRRREIAGMADQLRSLQASMLARFERTQEGIDKRIQMAVGAKCEVIERDLRAVLEEELAFLGVEIKEKEGALAAAMGVAWGAAAHGQAVGAQAFEAIAASFEAASPVGGKGRRWGWVAGGRSYASWAVPAAVVVALPTTASPAPVVAPPAVTVASEATVATPTITVASAATVAPVVIAPSGTPDPPFDATTIPA